MDLPDDKDCIDTIAFRKLTTSIDEDRTISHIRRHANGRTDTHGENLTSSIQNSF